MTTEPAPTGREPSSAAERKFIRASATMADGTRVPLTEEQAEELWNECMRHKAEIEARLPDEQSALRAMCEAFHRLKDFGWRDAMYCPKDGSSFDVIEIGSTGIHRCHYSGEWPTGSWLIEDAGDLWPSSPVLFRLDPESEAARKQRMAEMAAKYRAKLEGEPNP